MLTTTRRRLTTLAAALLVFTATTTTHTHASMAPPQAPPPATTSDSLIRPPPSKNPHHHHLHLPHMPHLHAPHIHLPHLPKGGFLFSSSFHHPSPPGAGGPPSLPHHHHPHHQQPSPAGPSIHDMLKGGGGSKSATAAGVFSGSSSWNEHHGHPDSSSSSSNSDGGNGNGGGDPNAPANKFYKYRHLYPHLQMKGFFQSLRSWTSFKQYCRGVRDFLLIAKPLEALLLSSGTVHDRDLSRFMSRAAAILAYSLIITTVLGTFCGVDTKPLIAGLGVSGFIVGFALKEIATNMLSGVLLIFQRPIKTGWKIKVGNFQGTVLSIDSRYVRLLADDESMILVPAYQVYTQPITVIERRDKSGKVIHSAGSLTPSPAASGGAGGGAAVPPAGGGGGKN